MYRGDTFTSTVDIRSKYPSLKYHLICKDMVQTYIKPSQRRKSILLRVHHLPSRKACQSDASPHQQLTDPPRFLGQARLCVMTDPTKHLQRRLQRYDIPAHGLMLSPSYTRSCTKNPHFPQPWLECALSLSSSPLRSYFCYIVNL